MASTTITNHINFHDKLKSETLEAHQRLESLPISAAVTSPALTRSQYSQYLTLMLNIWLATEKVVFPKISSVFGDLDDRKKSVLIANDLKVIGKFDAVSDTEFNFSADGISEANAIGIFYVLEGSTLGGRYILQNVQSVLGFTPENGASYFAGYGNKTGANWKSFLTIVEEYERQSQCGDEIIEGANHAFSAIHDFMRNINED